MAYQARGRDPLFDSDTQAIIERRGRELIGLALMGAAILLVLMLGSYSADDPSWLAATDEPAQNLLGRAGASLAAPLYVIAGVGAWAVAAILAGWGLRFLLHAGPERAPARLIFAPIAVALVSIFASTHAVGAAWCQFCGLGGLFGDTVLMAVLGIFPFGPALGLKLLSVGFGAGAVLMMAYALGFTRSELRDHAVFLGGGAILAYGALVTLLWSGATGAAGRAGSPSGPTL